MCFVARSFSDQQPLQGLLWAEADESHVALVAVIDSQIPRWPAVAFLRGLVGNDVGLFSQECFDEPFGLAVGLRRVGLGSDGFQSQSLTGFSPIT